MEVLAIAPGELLRANFWLVPLVELPALDGEPPPRRALSSPHLACGLNRLDFLQPFKPFQARPYQGHKLIKLPREPFKTLQP